MSTNENKKKGKKPYKKQGKDGEGKGSKNQQKNFQSLWEMSEQEKLLQEEQQKMLNIKYRDRAKERRQGQYDLRQDGQGFAVISDSEDEENGEKMIQVKGLDFDLLREEQRRIEEAEEQNKQNKDTLEKIKQNVLKTQEQQELNKVKNELKKKNIQHPIAAGIVKVIKDQHKMKQGLFPKPFTYYRFDLQGLTYGSDLPTLIQKQRHQDQVQTMIASVSDNCYQKMGKIIKILKTGGRKQLREEREKEETIKVEEQNQNQIQSDDDSDMFGDDSPKPKTDKNKEKKTEQKPLKLLKDDEKIFDEEILPEEAEKLRKQKDQEKDQDTKGLNLTKTNSQTNTLNAKRKVNPFDDDDYYGECFQSSAPSINQIKKMKADGFLQKQKDEPKKKGKKDNYDQQYKKIEKILQEKKAN